MDYICPWTCVQSSLRERPFVLHAVALASAEASVCRIFALGGSVLLVSQALSRCEGPCWALWEAPPEKSSALTPSTAAGTADLSFYCEGFFSQS